MFVAQKMHYLNAGGGILVPAIGAAMSLPIVMFSLLGYDINPAFLLAPLIGIAFLMSFGRTGLAYIVAAVCGLASILAANKISADGALVKHIFSLVLIMFSPSFLFLGKYVSKSNDISKVFYWLSLFSSMFLIVVAARIFYLEQEVRIYIGPYGLAAMNAEFLGMPVFATFGVLSLAHLVCLQAMVLCGSLIGGKATKPVLTLFAIALFCASFLIVGSDSRSAQILLMWIVGSIVVYAIRKVNARRMCAVALLSILISFAITHARGMSSNRMVASIEAINSVPTESVPAPLEQPIAPEKLIEEKEHSIALEKLIQEKEHPITPEELMEKKWEKQADQFATGRVELAIAGAKEFMASPLIGNGFSGYGRYSNEGLSTVLLANSSTHVYFLTLLWKGGLIFFVPFVVMILFNLKAAIIGTKATEHSAERFFAWSAVLMAFGPMAMAWDILIVPSAGALAFFLFGLLGGLKNRAASPVSPFALHST